MSEPVAVVERKLIRAERTVADLTEVKIERDELLAAQRIWEQAAAKAVESRERMKMSLRSLNAYARHADSCLVRLDTWSERGGYFAKEIGCTCGLTAVRDGAFNA